MKLYLHIGSEKSGTTSLQKYLGLNREALAAAGFWYPAAFTTEEQVHRPLTDGALRRELEPGNEKRDAFETELRSAVERGIGVAMMSSEHLHSLVRDPAVAAYLHKFLAAYFDPIEIVYYARRQDALLASMHSTAVLLGATTNPKPFPIYASKGHYYFDHLAIAKLWAAEFGKEHLVCRIYERARLIKRDIVPDFEAIVGIPYDPNRHSRTANESLSLVCRSVLLRLNGSRLRNNNEVRQKFVGIDREGSYRRTPALTKSEAEKFLARFEDSNAEFFREYIDARLATDFEAGFDAFPDEFAEPSAEEMLEFIFKPKKQ